MSHNCTERRHRGFEFCLDCGPLGTSIIHLLKFRLPLDSKVTGFATRNIITSCAYFGTKSNRTQSTVVYEYHWAHTSKSIKQSCPRARRHEAAAIGHILPVQCCSGMQFSHARPWPSLPTSCADPLAMLSPTIYRKTPFTFFSAYIHFISRRLVCVLTVASTPTSPFRFPPDYRRPAIQVLRHAIVPVQRGKI